ncbi:uncharacterized protein LTR77_000836 [Saxophila tyrrhenica]|uniref:DUF1751-domain-containing protein n=1 Tax=Saxophila tyrrhenica TaxID=1690608 RepID=A0AAV9PPH0_9PEZI|nr:hypothetical protein LTR77_000836 [Saxophila tyrrhenica]
MPSRLNLPPLTRALFLVLLALSALNVSLRFRKWTTEDPSRAQHIIDYVRAPQLAIPYLVLIPTKSIRFPWTTLTAALVENNGVSLAISGLVIWFGGRYLERAWGSTEFAKFLLFTTMIPNIVTFLVYALWHAVTSTPDHPTPIQGLLAVEAGFLVALKQLVPEHTVSLFRGALRCRVKHFPAIFVLANMLSGPLLGTDTAFWLSLFGFLVSWVYLRFFRISEISTSATSGEGVTMKGDASDTFAFVAFFPDVMHPVLAPVSDGIYQVMVQLRLCTPFSDEAVEAGNEGVAARSETLPGIMESGRGGGGRRAEAERRRALALKALDQRLNAAAASRSANVSTASAAPSAAGDSVETAAGAGAEDGGGVKEAQA